MWVLGFLLSLLMVWGDWSRDVPAARSIPGFGPDSACQELLSSSASRIYQIPMPLAAIGLYLQTGLLLLCCSFSWQESLSAPISLWMPVVSIVSVVAGIGGVSAMLYSHGENRV